MKHTPGPWNLNDTFLDNGLYCVNAVCEQNGFKNPRVAEILTDHCIDAEAKANAQLIAAAPELLEALDYLLEQTVDMDLKHGIELSEGEEDARKKALKVLAKIAEG